MSPFGNSAGALDFLCIVWAGNAPAFSSHEAGRDD
jgi:hypothetical protein